MQGRTCVCAPCLGETLGGISHATFGDRRAPNMGPGPPEHQTLCAKMARMRDGSADHSGRGDRHTSLRFIISTALATARAVNAMYVIDGFWHAVEHIMEPSDTKRFFTSHAWFHLFRTPSFDVLLMRAPPI